MQASNSCAVRGSPLACRAPQPVRAGRRSVQVTAKKVADGPKVAIVGVTGAVGQEFLRVLHERDFPYSDLKLLASARSAGRSYSFEGVDYVVEELKEDRWGVARRFSVEVRQGDIVVAATDGLFDNVYPDEAASLAMSGMKWGKGGIIANPNCSTIIALMAVTPLHRAAKVKRMVVSTYQAASGAGQAAMEELEQQTREALEGKPVTTNIFPFQYAFNLFSHNSPMTDNGYNEEEMKLEEALAALAAFPGVSIINDRANNRFPTPLDASNQDDVYVGRVRRDVSRPDAKGLDIFVCGDQIKKGAALNAVQVAELLL
ncbi:hypothetical protein CHLNCDRAFT_134577 [Chlorella variabilis]|uniref:Semialdehyde dehydrogenase NAD-binding domain-containing protein n=1 Tax=Chlorella variabilis TaxID=554065 RepID=E1ZG87_CHLVA|nr:hypothetical protein CHLNCDRAFT_134577 [Chlorella variabilis]EFN55249.1 hypothetical protein CHLNCDRAFT_134577 [Chlorella variabilis]|eukprot:XP_005847351.1 hypothetical protein CHLNCDRAFT_134577 [Chlorella variabilis]